MSGKALNESRLRASSHSTIRVDEDLRLVIVRTQIPWLGVRIDRIDVMLWSPAKQFFQLASLVSCG